MLPVLYPVIAIEEIEEPARGEAADELQRALAAGIEAIVTSPTAAEILTALLPASHTGRTTRVFSIGKTTSEILKTVFKHVDTSPVGTAAGLAQFIEAVHGNVAGRRFVLPRAKKGREELPQALRAAGAVIDPVVLYETHPIEGLAPLRDFEAEDWITFASPSAVRAFIGANPPPIHARVACIGPVTQEEAIRHGMRVHAVPDTPSAERLGQAIADFRP